jgi:hypothetical protein
MVNGRLIAPARLAITRPPARTRPNRSALGAQFAIHAIARMIGDRLAAAGPTLSPGARSGATPESLRPRTPRTLQARPARASARPRRQCRRGSRQSRAKARTCPAAAPRRRTAETQGRTKSMRPANRLSSSASFRARRPRRQRGILSHDRQDGQFGGRSAISAETLQAPRRAPRNDNGDQTQPLSSRMASCQIISMPASLSLRHGIAAKFSPP